MIKNIKRNVFVQNKKTIYEQECKLTHELLASDDNNIEIEYYNDVEAKNARASVLLYIKKVRQPLEVMQRGKFLIIQKKTKE